MGCLFDAPSDDEHEYGGYVEEDLDEGYDVGTGVIFRDPVRDVWDMGNIRCPSRGGYSIAPLFDFGQDSVETDSRASVQLCNEDVEFVFNVDSEVIGRGVLVMKKQAPNEAVRSVAFHDMNFNLLREGTMFLEFGKLRKLKLKFKPPPVYGAEQKKYWVLVLLQKDARNFMSVGSQPRTHIYATNPIPENFLGQNDIVIQNVAPKPTTWRGGPLPQGWIQENDPVSGTYFFVNTANGEVSWTPPLMSLPQSPKQTYRYPKDPELDQVSESVSWNGNDTRQASFRNCNRICVCQMGSGFVVKGTNITGKWRVARRGLKLTWNNYSGRGEPKYNKITTSMSSLPELLKGPPAVPIRQLIQGPPMGQQMQGAGAPYQDPNAIGQPQAVGPSFGAQPQVGVPQTYGPPQGVGAQPVYAAPPPQQVGVVPAGAYQSPPSYDVSGGAQYQAPPVSGGPVYQAGPSYQQAPYGQPQYGQPQYVQPQSQPTYAQPQYGQPQYGQPQYGQPQYGQPQYGQPQYGQPQYGQPQYGYQQPPAFEPMPTPAGGWAPPATAPPERSNKAAKYVAAAVGVAAIGGGMYLAHEYLEHQAKEEARRQQRMFNQFSSNMNSNREYSDSSDYWRREAERARRRQREAERQLREEERQNAMLMNEQKGDLPMEEEELAVEEPMEVGAMEMEEYDDEEEYEEEEEVVEEEVVDAPEEEVEDAPEENEEAEEYMAAGAGPWDFQDPPSDGEGNVVQDQQKYQVQVVPPNVIVKGKPSDSVAIDVKKSKIARIQEYVDKNDFHKQSYKTNSFYLRSKKSVGKNAIGIVTQLSMDRLPMLKAMICSWDGHISAAVYITNKEEDLPRLKELFHFTENDMSTSLDLHLLFSSNEGDSYYPINNLRNLALREVRSEFVFLLDIDFTISATLDVEVTMEMKTMLKSGRKALVVPALEPIGCYGRAGEDLTPQEIDLCLKQGTVSGFHTKHFAAGHSATDLDRWVKATAPYRVQYQHCYEPYVIMRKDQVPEYDERFRGYGMNKISHLMKVSTNTDFHVLPDVYVMSIHHEKSKDWKRTFRGDKKRERLIEMQALFNIFKSELLLNNPDKQLGKKNGNKYMNILSTATRTVAFMALVTIGKMIITG